eukprot:scaffold1113_cov76-Skeletonema_marinoi.AAC.1
MRISTGEDLTQGQSVFEHLTEFVVDRVLHAVVQMNSLVELKAHSAAVEEEARVARRVREKAASGQCIICLDEHPNISTLCCGQAIHHNCLTEWLSNQGTCIACRKAMPKIPRTLQRQDAPPTNANASNDSANETTESTTDTTSDNDVVQQQDNNDTTEDDTTDDTTSDDDVVQQQANDNDTTEDDTTDDTTSDDDVVQQQANNNDTTEDTTDDTTEDTTDDTESAGNSPVVQSIFCGQCQRNKFAVDCSNSMCGRCCQIYGSLSCNRHYC